MTDPKEVVHHPNYGLTKREWFAGMALMGLIQQGRDDVSTSQCAIDAVTTADALIKALNGNGEK